MKFILMLLVSAQVFGAAVLSSQGAYQLNRMGPAARKHNLGTNLLSASQFGVKASWSFSRDGGTAFTQIPMKDEEGLSVKLPSGAVITNCLIDVVTQPTSGAANAGRVSVSSKAIGDLKAEGNLSAYSTGLKACVPDGTTGAAIRLASETTLKLVVASEALTAGKINVWVEYLISE